MNILITGVSKGVGLLTTQVLLEKGHTVFGISRTKTAPLDGLISEFPERLKWLSYDLTQGKNVNQLIFKNWITSETPLDGFINNAAIAYDDIITNLKVENLENMFKVNVFTPMLISKYFIRQSLLHNISGSIIHLSSISVHTGYKGLAMYASTKGALEAFSKNTAREWGERGIRSNCVVPGFMETEMSGGLSIEQKDRIFNRTSMKKATELMSVAETIAFLISDKASSITGQKIFVDCGTI